MGDNYVHRLIQSKTDGKLVELNAHCVHAIENGCGSCSCEENAMNEAMLNSKVEAVMFQDHFDHSKSQFPCIHRVFFSFF